MVTITDLGKHYGGQTLFTGASLQFEAGKRYGIVGANGSGKSTLLRIIAGEETASEGSVTIPRRVRVGVLEQDHFALEDVPILDVVMMGHTELWSAMSKKEALLSGPEEDFDAHRFADLEEVILRLNGYALESRAAEILEGMQIGAAVHREPLSVLSGGYKLRVLLARTLAGAPDLLLLDEPNNHLDILSLRWLEKFLVDFKGCAIVVSHDQRFLDNVCTHVVDVDYQIVTLYTGNHAAFVAAKDMERTRREKDIARREQEIADHTAFVTRFRAKATKARQANSRQKRLEKIVLEPLPVSSRQHPKFAFPQRRPSGRKVLDAIGITKAYGDNIVLCDVDLEVQRGDRVAILGPNGIGKSTLLKVLTGQIEADDGLVEWGYETHPATFGQDHREVMEHRGDTVSGWLWSRAPELGIGDIYGRLARVLFHRDDADKKIENLSGGEASRLLLAGIAVRQPNVIVLDEPTNHLDLEGIEALAEALRQIESTVIFVSHDRWFVSAVATRILEIRRDGVTDYRGTYEEYLQHCETDHLDRAPVRKGGGKEIRRPDGKKGRRKGARQR